MIKLTMRDTIENGKYANKTVEEITKISGAIFSMIKDGYEFDKWSDSNTQNPRQINITESKSFTASFKEKTKYAYDTKQCHSH